jgi:Phage capsid protein
MSAYGTKVAEGFSRKLIKKIYESAPIDEIVNRDYEGEINAVGSVLNILSLNKITEKTYSGSNLTADDLTEVNTVFRIAQQKAFYWKEKTIDKWVSYIKNPRGTVLEQTANERKKNIMTFILGFYSDVASGNWYGTSYTTGTVTVDVTTGAVTGSGTTFTSGMVGKPFKALGHTQWYRVKSYSSTTAIVIEDDSDDLTSAYTGGAIGAGATYEIQANTVKTIDNSSGKTFLEMVLALKQMLDENEVPDEDRFLVVPPAAWSTMARDTGIKLAVEPAYEALVIKGYMGTLEGFKIIKTNRLTGDNTNGYHVLGGHKNFLTFADKALEVGMEEDLIGNFGTAYKDLFVYDAKVADDRRKFGVHAFVKFA